MNHNINILLADIDTLPTLPAIVGQVMQTIADPQSSAQDLMEVINPDQALTVKILKIANSAFYGRVRKTGTLEQALIVLGFEEVRNLVVSMAVFNNFRRLNAPPLFEVGKFWEHSFVCGLAARIIAEELKLPGGELFVAGLIHDIGKLAICMVVPQVFCKVLEADESKDLKTSVAEQHLLGVTHAEVGAVLAKRWMFPGDLVAGIGFHHRPAAGPAKTPYQMIVHLADLIAHMVSDADAPGDNLVHESWFEPEFVEKVQSCGLVWNPDTLRQIKTELEAQKESQAGILEIFLS